MADSNPSDEQQFKPLAPYSALRVQTHNVVDEETFSIQSDPKQRKYITCCGCFTAVFLILSVVILILAFTVFHIKDPVIRITKVTANVTQTNVTLLAEVSVKNPNVASFKFDRGTTDVYYNGTVVGGGWTPPGKAEARRTMRMNVTVEMDRTRVLGMVEDAGSGSLSMSSYTVIGGRVKIMKVVKKHVVVKTNCTMTYNISSQAIQGQNCRPKIIV